MLKNAELRTAADFAMENETETILDTGRGGVVTARGTSDGLVIRLDGRVDRGSLKTAVSEFMEPRRSFLAGHEVALEWVGLKPESSTADEISSLLQSDYKVVVRSSKLRASISKEFSEEREGVRSESLDGLIDYQDDLPPKTSAPSRRFAEKIVDKADKTAERPRSLFHGINEIDPKGLQRAAHRASADPARVISDPLLWDEPDGRVIYATLRSGQRIESEHSVILIGDVNPGAEIVAGGDIIVLGTLRGVAHAGAYEETGGGRIIFALSLQPTQLRIGGVISRGSEENRKDPEIARVDGTTIMVEPFSTRHSWIRKAL